MPTQRPSPYRRLAGFLFTLLCIAALSSMRLDAQSQSQSQPRSGDDTGHRNGHRSAGANGGNPSAREVVRQAMDAMGGEARLRQIRTLRVESIGHRYLLDQSERPEGPWIAYYEQRTELRDVEHQRLRVSSDSRSVQNPKWDNPATTIVALPATRPAASPAGASTSPSEGGVAAMLRGDKLTAGRPQQVADASATLALEPERLLFTARDAADLTLLSDEPLQNVAQRRLRFTWNQKALVLWINAHTLLPTALDITSDDDGADIWGEVTRRVLFSYWNVESNGLLYPRQRNILWNGYPQSELSISALTINPSDIAADAFDIPADVRTAYANAPRMNYRTMPLGQRAKDNTDSNGIIIDTLADGITQIPGAWNVAFVRQPDGLVIIEAPISSEYSAQVLDEASKRYPNVRVKAVITTSDAWPHLAGVREYAARGIPIYALDLNKPILERLLAARYTTRPDRLAQQPRKADLRLVSAKTVIGDGDNQLVLHPIRGENGERMMLVHLPARRLLYTSDEVMHASRTSDDFFMPSYLAEVQASMQRAGIDRVDTIFGMHLRATPWTVIEQALDKARPRPQGDTPSLPLR